MSSDRKMWGQVMAYSDGARRREPPEGKIDDSAVGDRRTGDGRRTHTQPQLVDFQEVRRLLRIEPSVNGGESAMARKPKTQSRTTAAESGDGQAASGRREPEATKSVPPGGDEDTLHPRIMDRHVQSELGRHLRAMFDDVATAPVPDKFVQLLQALEDKEKQR